VSLAERYRRIRGGWQFLAGLATFIVVWAVLHAIEGLDRDWTILNLILSMEASVSVALLIASQADNDANTLAILRHIEKLIEEKTDAIRRQTQ